MPVSSEKIKKIFQHLESGNSHEFFEHVASDVEWKVMGTHPLAGTYKNKENFIAHTFNRLDKVLKEGVILKVTNILKDGNSAAVEMESLSTTNNGKPFKNTYCWILEFQNEVIIKVRAYVDSALVQRVIDENEG